MACPAGRVTVTVHPVMAAVPVLVTRAGWMTYPVCHWVWVTSVMEHPPPPPPPADWVVTDTVLETADRLPAASLARTWYRNVLPAARPVSANEFVVGEATTEKAPLAP